MTYREMMNRDHPEWCGARFIGGCLACPGNTYPGGPDEDNMGDACPFNADHGISSEYIRVKCTACWDQDAKKDLTE